MFLMGMAPGNHWNLIDGFAVRVEPHPSDLEPSPKPSPLFYARARARAL